MLLFNYNINQGRSQGGRLRARPSQTKCCLAQLRTIIMSKFQIF